MILHGKTCCEIGKEALKAIVPCSTNLKVDVLYWSLQFL
ncbi:hypothetical protein IC006_0654 [Sulfuracidifex tepidarius]|uniref:Uncharacterized protein n=1 Tax=Sulfuracidifex tepidarius TaxID=1294262 RepID=A0A510E0V4_9CREN|nr:hypothetical protein IC006_0654 [Sulfuracidifex tepidarius]BBG26123.1 hypothetical protein IC007_0628 [Sulfuracidifex tepidarius]